jgi:hypothetical protein
MTNALIRVKKNRFTGRKPVEQNMKGKSVTQVAQQSGMA